MVDFRCTEYAADKVVADPEIRKKIIKIGIRRITHDSKVDCKTVRLVANGQRVKTSTLSKLISVLDRMDANVRVSQLDKPVIAEN